MTADQLEALRHLQGVSDPSAAEILRTLAPAQRARPLKVQVPVLDVLLANPAHGFGDVELQALSAIPWQVHLLADEAPWQMSACRSARPQLTPTLMAEPLPRSTVRGSPTARAQSSPCDTLSLLKVGLGQRNQVAVTRRARARRELPRSEAP